MHDNLRYNEIMNIKELYSLLDLSKEEDLLRIFPSRYESLKSSSFTTTPANGQRFVFKGIPLNVKCLNTAKISIIRFQLDISYHKIDCIVYNQPFYGIKLSSGKELCFVLYYSVARKAYIVYSIYDADSYYVMTGIKPVYNLPKGVSQSYFASSIRKVLSYPTSASYMVSSLPERLIKKYHLINEFDAYRFVHLPRDEKNLYEGLRVFKYEEALQYCVKALSLKKEMQAKKKNDSKPISHKAVNEFVRNLTFKPTTDQLAAIRDIILDMEKEEVMYRLLQGDVGTGKTLVAFVSLYGNCLRKKQGVLMAPTFELAMQHYENIQKMFQPYSIKVGFLAGNAMKAKERRELLQGLQIGEVSVLVSTTSVLSDNVKFADLGLVVIDEQQLFGVEQREKVLSKSGIADILMMSATPIPRTLSQIINADLDVSTLNQFPSGKRNVETRVVQSMDPLIYKAIDKALLSQRQVFIVAPKISQGERETSSAKQVFDEISSRYPGKANLLHGKIKKDSQDQIIKSFINNEKPILVSTTVIQVGIDVSSACLLIVYDANCFGLSTLHQLRGRIGRSGEYALAILVYDGDDKDALDKLHFLVSCDDGLKISEFDLKQRGSGSYAGTNQSGKSELMVCNFVDDLKMFECARKDASDILSDPKNSENANYLKSIDMDDKLNIG